MYGSKHIRSNPPSTTSGLSIDISAKTNELGVLYHHCTSKRIRHIKVDQRRLRPHRAATFEILWIQEFKKKGGREIKRRRRRTTTTTTTTTRTLTNSQRSNLWNCQGGSITTLCDSCRTRRRRRRRRTTTTK